MSDNDDVILNIDNKNDLKQHKEDHPLTVDEKMHSAQSEEKSLSYDLNTKIEAFKTPSYEESSSVRKEEEE